VNALADGERLRLLNLDDRALAQECEIDLYRASGAGGQKRNKTSSAVRMRHKGSGVSSSASDSRSQADNRRAALLRLRTNIALDLREGVDMECESWPDLVAAVRRGPLGRNAKTRAIVPYLAVLAQILDMVHAHEGALSKAAAHMGISTASLGKLIQGDERLARRVAELRSQHGLRPLR